MFWLRHKLMSADGACAALLKPRHDTVFVECVSEFWIVGTWEGDNVVVQFKIILADGTLLL